MKFSYIYYEMFQKRNPEQPTVVLTNDLNPKFTEALGSGDLENNMKTLNSRITDFIKKLFGTGIKASDISYDYIHHMYELYPNHKLHCELITKSLQLLCDIATEDQMHTFLKLRQQSFFDHLQNLQFLQ